MIRRPVLIALLLCVMLGAEPASTSPGAQEIVAPTSRPCAFRFGFKELADQIPNHVGECTSDEKHGANGDGLQTTTRGLMVWRKADNWTAFTNGELTWVNGPFGVWLRTNETRFCFEGDADPTVCLNAPLVIVFSIE
jgi:hypothetical protein